ncbi:ThiF family adenylyltransferase [Streptomyces sp. 8L]|uniref:ThiF family adenylyltransferase n=1 Tax=Streptomyces sp. 8L TaxID=2877242 RepID=UPI001CD45EEA|nr:ThiF family adenylyltransferase [Streptomyces sp. 8L]MCA1217115.1 ThiF family adenylyltransferase [Streptomyces sp. 8L]
MADHFVRLLDTVTVALPTARDERTLVARGPHMLRIRNGDQALDDALEQLRAGVEERTVRGDGAGPAVRRLLTTLDELGWLTREPAHTSSEAAWDRQVGWWSTVTTEPGVAQRKLAAARVAVIGVGGVGALVAQHLVAGGVRQLSLIDHDTVASHNLNRQYLFRRSDVGRPKVEAAAESLGNLADGLDLRPIHRRVERTDDLDVLTDPPDLLIVAADTPADLMDTVWTWARKQWVPVVGAGVGLESGYWGPLLDPRRGHCWFCVEEDRRCRLTADERRLEEAAGPTPYSFGPTNALIADLTARDAMLWLAVGRCASLGRRQVLDVVGMRHEPESTRHGTDVGPAKAPPSTPPGGCPLHAEGVS